MHMQDFNDSQVSELINHARAVIAKNSVRVATLGGWAEGDDVLVRLLIRVPSNEEPRPGFDAAIACALDLIPPERQRLPAKLHGAWDAEAVQQIRHEAKEMHPNAETTWWLAACHVCREGNVDSRAFLTQIERFEELVKDPEERRNRAIETFTKMGKAFEMTAEGIPLGFNDGCIQGAYIHGHRYGTQWSKHQQLYFIGTYLPSLGLEEFGWWSPNSGPVHGSKQFVKCTTNDEFLDAVKTVRTYLGV